MPQDPPKKLERNRFALKLTLVERKTQLAKIIKLPRATAHATQRAAVRRLKPIGDFVHTIAFDNGKEFAAHQDIAHEGQDLLRHAISRMGAWL